MLSVLLLSHMTLTMWPLLHGIRLYNCMILLLEYTGMCVNTVCKKNIFKWLGWPCQQQLVYTEVVYQ